MKSNLFMKICALLLAACIVVTGTTAVQIMKVYAEEFENFEDGDNDDFDEGETDYYQENDQPQGVQPPANNEEEQKEEDEPDPFDYDLVCYTPNINFGTVYRGDTYPAKQFSVVNTGLTSFPLTWEEIDQYTAFDIGYISPSLQLDPGDAVTFSICPQDDLAPGTYSASYTFFSENDFRRHHTTRVDVTVVVKDAQPYVTSVQISPGSVTIPTGKSYRFDAYVAGGNGYDASVIWSLVGNENAGTSIDSNGNLSVSSAETATSFAVIAASRQDPSVKDKAIVSVASVDYVISVKADPAEGGAVAGAGSVKAGGNTVVSASPNNNFTFKGWYEGGNLVSNNGQFALNNINSDRSLVAKFERKSCYIRTSVNDSNAGTVTGSASISYGGKITLTAKANNGYKFAGFVENNKTISTSSSVELNNVTTDRNIVAVFNRDTCNVNVSVNPQDTGKYEGAGKYNKGTKVELKASAYDGYEFTGWTINGQVVCRDSKYVIDKIQNDVNVVANFMKKNATVYKLVSGITNAGGSIVPSGDYNVPEGGSVTYNIVAQNDYKISAVVVDGKNIGAVASYTFNNVKGGHTITATFEKKPVEAPKNSAQTSSQKQASASKPAATDTTSQKKTSYNENTAAQGAMPEQNVIATEVSAEKEVLTGDEYKDDFYTEANDTEIVEEAAPTAPGSVMARHNLDEGTLKILIDDDAVLPMLKEAFEDGTLQITVNNTYAADPQETSVEMYYQKPTLTNFEDVIAETLSPEEKLSVLTGTPVSFNIDITENTGTVDDNTKHLMQKKVGYKPVTYFDFAIMKTSGGTTSVIEKTASELEVVIPIPEQYRKEGRKFYVMRNHNGVVDVLQDIGNDPETITFRTDKFSEYAIAYEAININTLILRFAIVGMISLILAVICFVSLVKYKRTARIKNRK